MPWNRTDWMSERVKFIAAYLEYEASFIDLCRDFGVSRKTGYTWVRRYEANGAAALADHSRAPHSHPHGVPAHIRDAASGGARRTETGCASTTRRTRSGAPTSKVASRLAAGVTASAVTR